MGEKYGYDPIAKNHFGNKMIHDLKGFAIRGLRRMYLPGEQLFVFRFNRHGNKVLAEGKSLRYTAISLIGLAECDDNTAHEILNGHTRTMVFERLQNGIKDSENLGDVALSLWAANRIQYKNRQYLIDKVLSFEPHKKGFPTVELSWALDALCREPQKTAQSMAVKLANRLMDAQNKISGVFPHHIGISSGLRSHVSCFADAVYPIHALSTFYGAFDSREALQSAAQCARMICDRQGPTGQWWWHYDVRTGRVIEGYPVYSVHQDSMGPMALLALQAVGGPDHRKAILKGMEWLQWSEEIDSSLMDQKVDLIWRKVARREPNKLSRSLQAAVSRVHCSLRIPAIDSIFPARAIDYENRPYHLGWILYAWKQAHSDIWMK